MTYGNFEADDVDIYVPTAGVAVPVGLQGFTLGDRVNRASEFLRAGLGMDGFSDQGADYSDDSSVASWNSCG